MVNNRSVIKWELWGIPWIVIVGCILHFTYKWSNNSPIVGAFSPVNESVWEHLKLGYFSLLTFSIVEYWFIKDKVNNFFLGKTVGVVSMELFIIIVYYTYTWISKKPILFIDILSYVIGSIICQLVCLKVMKARISKTLESISAILFILIGCSFILFTFYTPRLPIFMDSKKKKYGI